MKELIDAAVQAASRQGVQAAVVLLGPEGNGAVDTPQRAVAPAAAGPEVMQERDALRARVEQLQDALEQAQQAAQAVGTGDQGAALAQAQSQVATLTEQLQAAQQEIEQIKAAGPAQTGGEGEQATTVEAFDSYGIEHLGLDDKEEKALRKVGFETIGAVRETYLAGELKEKTKLTKDGMISVGIHLLGKAPSASHAQTATAPAAANANAGAAADVPEQHSDRAWMDRFNAARAKENRMQEVQKTLTSLRNEALQQHPGAKMGDNGEVNMAKLPPEMADRIRTEENTCNVVRGQMIAMLWACNLPADKGSVDGALEAAQLQGLMQNQPAGATA